jgi:hypothetical protein
MKLLEGYSRYWFLLQSLLVPARFIKGYLWVVLGFIFLGVLTYPFNNTKLLFSVSFVMGFALFFLYSFLIFLMVPAQLLSIVSSKPISLLANFKQISFVFLVVLSLIFSSFILLSVYILEKKDLSLVNFLMILIIFSCFIFTHIFVYKINQSAFRYYGFVFVIFISIKPYFSYLLSLNEFLLISIVVVIWCFFSLWWFKWKPEKFYENFMFSNFNNIQGKKYSHIPDFFNKNYFSGKANIGSLKGNFLLGTSDNYETAIKNLLTYFVVLSAVMFFFLYMFKNDFYKIFDTIGYIIIAVFIYIGPCAYFFNIYKNIKRIWLIHDGTRESLFFSVETIFLKKILLETSILITLLVFFQWAFLPNAVVLTNFLIMSLVVLLMALISFYGLLFFYYRCQENVYSFKCHQAIANIVMVPAVLLMAWLTQHYLLVGVIGVFIFGILALCLRYWTANHWKRVDFFKAEF